MQFDYTYSQIVGRDAVMKVLSHFGWSWCYHSEGNDHGFACPPDENKRVHWVRWDKFSPREAIVIFLRRYERMWLATGARVIMPERSDFVFYRFIYDPSTFEFRGLRRIDFGEYADLGDLDKCFEEYPPVDEGLCPECEQWVPVYVDLRTDGYDLAPHQCLGTCPGSGRIPERTRTTRDGRVI